MNVWTGRLCLCMTLLCVGAISVAQVEAPRAEQPKPSQRPSPAEQPEELLLMEAMEHNPDIRTAKAEMEKAQAELEATRFRVAREVLNLRSELKALEKILEKARRRVDIGTASTDELVEVELEFLKAENQLQYLLGNVGGRPLGTRPGGGGGFAGGFGGGGGRVGGFAAFAQMRIPQPRPEYEEGTPERLREMLENPIAITFEDINLMDIFEFITHTYEINITVDLAFTPPMIRQINLRDVPLRSAFLALTDKMDDACFVIRDYGLFLTTRERAQTLAGVTIPEDVPYFAPLPPGQFQGGFGGGWFGGGGGGGFGGGFGGGGGGFGGATPPPQMPNN